MSKYLCSRMYSPLGTCPGAVELDHIDLFLAFCEIATLISIPTVNPLSYNSNCPGKSGSVIHKCHECYGHNQSPSDWI